MKTWTRLLIPSVLFLALALPAIGNDADNPQEVEQAFKNGLIQSLQRMKELINRKTYRIQTVNQSLEKTIDAVNALASDQSDLIKAEALLRQATELLSNNILAELILADVYEKQSKIEKANEQYRRFLDKSTIATSLTQDIMSWKTRLALSRYARAKLSARGIVVPESKSLPLIARLETEQNAYLLQTISLGLPIIIIFSTFFLVLGFALTDGDITRQRYYRVLSRFYFVLILSYGLWLLHILLQIPAFLSREEHEVIALILVGAIGIGVIEFISSLKARENERSDPSMTMCRRCKKLIEKLAAFCPYCQERF